MKPKNMFLLKNLFAVDPVGARSVMATLRKQKVIETLI